jgi:O-methyltransferase involved in polyketide biosynthesis
LRRGDTRLGDLSQTAYRTLADRAAESARPDGLFRDAVAEAAAASLGCEIASVPALRFSATAHAIRTRIIDDWVQEILAGRRRVDVLNVGAGLCTRFFRLGPIPGIWYEIDLPGIIDVRQRVFPRSANHVELACSVLDPRWSELIPRQASVLVIAEGLLFYLAETAARELLRQLAAAFAGAAMIFDVLGPAQVGRQGEIDILTDLNAPFRWGLADTRSIESWDPRIEWRREESIFDRCPERWGKNLPSLRRLRRSYGNRIVEACFRPCLIGS